MKKNSSSPEHLSDSDRIREIILASRAGSKPSTSLYAVLVSLILLAAIGGTFYHTARYYRSSVKLMIAQFDQQQLTLARSIARGIETFLLDINDDVLALARLPAVQNMDVSMLQTMEALYIGFPPETSSRRVDKEGILRFIYPNEGWRKSLIGRDYSGEAYFRKARATNDVCVSDIIVNEVGNRRIRVARPVYVYPKEEERAFDGVIVCSFDPGTLASLYVDPVVSGETGYAWLINEEGAFMAHREKEFVGQNAFKARPEKRPEVSAQSINWIQGKMMAAKEGTGRYVSGRHRKQSGSIQKLIAYTPVGALDKTWSVAVCMPVSEAEDVVTSVYVSESVSLAFIIVVMMAGGIFFYVALYRWGRSLKREIAVRKRSEEALKLSERKFRDLAENTTDWVWEVDTEGICTYTNPKVQDVLGHMTDEIMGKSLFQFVAGDHLERIRKLFYQKVSSKEPFSAVENVNRHKDGHLLVLETSGVPVFDTEAQLKGYRGISREITERTRMLEAVRESEEKFRVICEGSADGILVVDIRSGRIMYANPAICGMLGWSEMELVKLTVHDIYPKEDLGHVEPQLEALMSGKAAKMDAIPCLKKDGGILFADVSSKKIVYGEVERVVGFFRDITERERMDKAIRESEARYRLIVETMSEGLGILDREGIFTYVNNRLTEILGYTRDDMIGHSIFDFLDHGNRKKLEEQWGKGKRRVPYGYEIAWITKDGRNIPTILSPAPILSVDGEFSGSLVVVTDITEHKMDLEKLEDSLRKLQKTIKSTVHALAKVVEARDPYTAGHQLRVAQIAVAVGKEMMLSEEHIKGLYMAGVTHDIGKIAVPTEFLTRPGLQSEGEINIMRKHPQVAYEILSNLEFPWPIAQIALQHHERMDGSGYPQGLSGEEIILEARILGVVDVIESMSSHRPYRPSLGLEKALEEISKNKGKLYDAEVVDACMRVLGEEGREFPTHQQYTEDMVWNVP